MPAPARAASCAIAFAFSAWFSLDHDPGQGDQPDEQHQQHQRDRALLPVTASA
jgi:hypothetical protein